MKPALHYARKAGKVLLAGAATYMLGVALGLAHPDIVTADTYAVSGEACGVLHLRKWWQQKIATDYLLGHATRGELVYFTQTDSANIPIVECLLARGD